MLVWVELTGRRIRQTPRAARKLIEAGVGQIADESKAAYEEWLKGQKPASTVTAPEKPKVTKRIRRQNNAST